MISDGTGELCPDFPVFASLFNFSYSSRAEENFIQYRLFILFKGFSLVLFPLIIDIVSVARVKSSLFDHLPEFFLRGVIMFICSSPDLNFCFALKFFLGFISFALVPLHTL